jgi:hypothetical protein
MTSIKEIMEEENRKRREELNRLYQESPFFNTWTAPNSTTQNVVPPKTQDATGTPREEGSEDSTTSGLVRDIFQLVSVHPIPIEICYGLLSHACLFVT